MVSMVSAAVVALDEILEAQWCCGTSEPQRGQAALQELGNGDGVKSEDRRRSGGQQPIKHFAITYQSPILRTGSSEDSELGKVKFAQNNKLYMI